MIDTSTLGRQGDIVFSTYAGLTLSGNAGMTGAPAAVVEFRSLRPVLTLPEGAAVLFCRALMIDGVAGRLVGAFRIARDQMNRVGYFGYAVASHGREMQVGDGLISRLEAFALDDEHEASIRQLTRNSSYFYGGSEPKTSHNITTYSVGRAERFSLSFDYDKFTIWRLLWQASWSGTTADILLASADFSDSSLLDAEAIEERWRKETHSQTTETRTSHRVSVAPLNFDPTPSHSQAESQQKSANNETVTELTQESLLQGSHQKPPGYRDPWENLDAKSPQWELIERINQLSQAHRETTAQFSDLVEKYNTLSARVYSLRQPGGRGGDRINGLGAPLPRTSRRSLRVRVAIACSLAVIGLFVSLYIFVFKDLF